MTPSLGILFKNYKKRILRGKETFTRSMQISQSSPSPDWLGVARGEEIMRRNKRRGFMPIFFLLCARTLPSLPSVGSRYTLMLIQGAYLGTGNKYKMDPFNSVIKAAVQMVTKPKILSFKTRFFACDGQIKGPRCFIVWIFCHLLNPFELIPVCDLKFTSLVFPLSLFSFNECVVLRRSSSNKLRYLAFSPQRVYWQTAVRWAQLYFHTTFLSDWA